MGDERDIPKPDTSYMGVSHEQLKSWTDKGQPAGANELGESWQKLGNGLTEAAENLMVAVFGSESGWTGQAANAMRAQLTKVADWSQKTGESFNKASEAFNKQGESVETAKSSMPEVVKYDPGQMIKDAATSGNPIKIAMLPYSMHKQAEASKEAHQQAATVVAKRDEQLALAAASIPPFEAPPTLSGEDGKKPGSGEQEFPGSSGHSGANQPGPGNPGNPGGGFHPGNGPGNGPGRGPGNVPGPGPGPGFIPANPGQPGNGSTGTAGYLPPADLPSNTSNNFQQTPSNGPGGSGPYGGGGPFGAPYGSGGFGPGASSGTGTGARPGSFGPTGQGAGSGAGGGPGAGGMGRGGAMGASGGRGGMGAGGAGGHKGEGGEDGEHQRPSYLVEPDPDAMFGTDQLTAPPVIGG